MISYHKIRDSLRLLSLFQSYFLDLMHLSYSCFTTFAAKGSFTVQVVNAEFALALAMEFIDSCILNKGK